MPTWLLIVIALLGLAILAAGIAAFYMFTAGVDLPDRTDAVIADVMEESLPTIVTGETGFATHDGVDIWYESRMPDGEPTGTILLIMGISTDALAWPDELLDALTDAGYRVVRFDHRDTGMSDWLDDWNEDDPYDLDDMARDTLAVLDALDIQRAHLLGMSMGGMIGQHIAIHYPERAATLTSLMSSGDITDDELPPISREVGRALIQTFLKYSLIGNEQSTIKANLASRIILRGEADYDIDISSVAERTLHDLRERDGYNSDAIKHHQEAILTSGSRYDGLRALEVPTLVMHGELDPFIPIEHSQKLADVIPDAESDWVDNMGHDLPPNHVPHLTRRMLAFIESNDPDHHDDTVDVADTADATV